MTEDPAGDFSWEAHRITEVTGFGSVPGRTFPQIPGLTAPSLQALTWVSVEGRSSVSKGVQSTVKWESCCSKAWSGQKAWHFVSKTQRGRFYLLLGIYFLGYHRSYDERISVQETSSSSSQSPLYPERKWRCPLRHHCWHFPKCSTWHTGPAR